LYKIFSEGCLKKRKSQLIEDIGFWWNKMREWIVSNAIELNSQNITMLAT